MLRASVPSAAAAAAASGSQARLSGVKRAHISSSQSVASGAGAAADDGGGGCSGDGAGGGKRSKRQKQSHQSSSSPGLAVTQIRPTKFVRATKFSASRWSELGCPRVRRVLELFLPSYLFPSNPRSLVRMKDRDISTSRIIQYVIMMRLLCYLAFKVSSPSYTEVADDDGEGGRKKKRLVRHDPQSEIVSTWEVVPHRDDPKVVVGYRLRFTEKSDDSSNGGMVEVFDALVEENERAEYKNHLRGGVEASKPWQGSTATISETSIKNICHDRWMRLCMEYAPELRDEVFPNQAFTGQSSQKHPFLRNLTNNQCPLYLEKVFSIDRSLRMAENLGADPLYCSRGRYIQHHTHKVGYAFASADNVWLVNHEDMKSYSIQDLYMPHIRPEPIEFAAQREAYVAQHAGANATDAMRARVAQTFDLEVVQTTNNERPMDTYTLDGQVRFDQADILAQLGSSDRRKVCLAMKARAKEVWIPMLTHIMDPDNNHAPPSLNAIGIAKQEFLDNNGHSFFRLRKRSTSNLTRFQDYTAVIMNSLNTIVTVRTNHSDCYLYLLCGLHVYAGSDLNPHVLALGPPGVGKSFRLKFLKLVLIDGTVRVVSDLTLKALNVEGNGNDYVIYIFDDAKATMLGVGHDIKNRNTPSSDRVNTIKEMMTSREATVQTIIFDKDGKRIGVFLKAKTTCVMMFNLNDPTCNFPDAVLDRAIVKVDSNHDSNDENTIDMISKTTRSNNPQVKAALGHIQSHWQRKQIIVSHILILISSGALPPVNLTMANIFFMLVKARARKRGVDMDGTRKHQRWCSIVSLLVITDAVDLLWSSPLSPFAPRNGQPAVHHDDSHFLEVAKYLCATTQHIILALGMMADQWKNDQKRVLLTAMLRLWFPQAALDSAKQERQVPVPLAKTIAPERNISAYDGMMMGNGDAAAAMEEMAYDGMVDKLKNWTHLTCESSAYKQLSSSAGPPSSGKNGGGGGHSYGKVYTKEELGRHVSQQLMEHLHPKPLEGEAESLIRQMMDQTVEETRLVSHGETIEFTGDCPQGKKVQDIRSEAKKVNALIVEHNRIRIAVSALDNHNVDGLYESVEEVACMLHHGEQERVYQYGETHPHIPHVWRQITAKKRAHEAKEMRIMNADHFDTMETEMTNALVQSSGGDRLPDTLFEKNEYYVPDVDLDEMVALKHGFTLGLSAQERLQSPSNVEAHSEAEWRAYWEGVQKSSFHYPNSFVRFQKGRQEKQMDAKARAHPEMYRMSTQMRRLKKQEEDWGKEAAPASQSVSAAAQPAARYGDDFEASDEDFDEMDLMQAEEEQDNDLMSQSE